MTEYNAQPVNLSESDKKLMDFYNASVDGVIKFFEEALLRVKNDGVKTQFNSHLGFVRLIKERLPELIKSPYELKAAHDALQERLRGLANDNNGLTERVAELSRDFDAQGVAKDKLGEEFVAYKKRAEEQINNLDSQIQQYEKDVADLNKQLTDAKKDKSGKKAGERVKELEGELARVNDEYAIVVKERDRLTEATILATQEIEASRTQVSSLEGQVASLTLENVEKDQELVSLKEKISQYESKISEYEGKIQELTDDLLDGAKGTDQTKLVRNLKGQITKWKKKQDELARERDKAQIVRKRLDKELSVVRAQLHEVQRVYKACSEDKDKLDEVLGKTQALYKKEGVKLAVTKTELYEERSRSRKLSRTITDLESVVAQLTRNSQRDTNELKEILIKYFNYTPKDFSGYKGQELTTYVIGRLGLEVASALLKTQKSAEKKLAKKKQVEKPVAKKKSDKKDKKSKKKDKK